MSFKEVPTSELTINPFTSIGQEWMLVCAGDESGHNAMTASWGGLGVMWGVDVATCYIRQTRYTKEFIDASERLTLSFFDESWRRALLHLGTVSGRDEDKIAAVGLTPYYVDGTTTFEEASLVLVCRKLSATFLSPDNFIDASIDARCYPDHDYHTMYICQIEKVLQAE